jgi:hypothetical protein
MGQAIFYGLAGWMADALPIVVIVLYGGNGGALGLAQGMVVGWCLGAMVLYGSNSESEQSASQCGSGGKSAGLAVLEKKRWWSDWMFSNFFRRLFS